MRRVAPRKVLRLVSPEPDERVVHMLERLLEQARAGELVGLGCAAVYRGSGYMLAFVGEERLRVYTSVSLLKAQLEKVILED